MNSIGVPEKRGAHAKSLMTRISKTAKNGFQEEITMNINSKGYICCPKCGEKTKTKVLPETVLMQFPLYCQRCKKESIINLKMQARA